MFKTPCEEGVWSVLPFIRKELACNLVKKYDIDQKAAAELLGLTPAALSQYKCKKRGLYSSDDFALINEIDVSTEKIFNQGNSTVVNEICRVCKFIRSNNIIIKKDE